MFLFLDKDDSGTISYEEFREYVLMKKKKSNLLLVLKRTDSFLIQTIAFQKALSQII